jgi:hypothetical protein
VAEVAQQRKAAKASGRPVDPEAEVRRERGRQMRAIAEQAHGANVDLGWGLMNGLAAVDPLREEPTRKPGSNRQAR